MSQYRWRIQSRRQQPGHLRGPDIPGDVLGQFRRPQSQLTERGGNGVAGVVADQHDGCPAIRIEEGEGRWVLGTEQGRQYGKGWYNVIHGEMNKSYDNEGLLTGLKT